MTDFGGIEDTKPRLPGRLLFSDGRGVAIRRVVEPTSDQCEFVQRLAHFFRRSRPANDVSLSLSQPI